MATLIVQGHAIESPAGEVYAPFNIRVPCNPEPSSRVIALSSDAPFVVSFDGLIGANVVQVEADHPVRMTIDSVAGSAQTIPLEFISLVSRSIDITAITFVRVAGQATTVRLTLGQEA